jgi:hypothetical protein
LRTSSTSSRPSTPQCLGREGGKNSKISNLTKK